MKKISKRDKFRKLKTALFSEYNRNPNITPKELARLATLYIEYDVSKLVLKEAKRQIYAFLAEAKKDDNLRKYFLNGRGKIIDVESASLDDYEKLEINFYKKIRGLMRSRENITKHKMLSKREAPLDTSETASSTGDTAAK